ncbi:cyclase family protein [Nocardia goodfellowii]|uniref:Cyclase n=1 Tax=Nocardia goodfellowii TaxID=882446 RepID=A0ABS4QMS3_9NOCA|nr:cyclase family protein [Nocardia goodfellowii]MBP2193005.1 cyclase [Nocardia goodfellowii]
MPGDWAGLLAGSELIDISSDIGNHAEGPFGTRIDALEPEPGAAFFCENVLPKIAAHAVGRLRAADFPDGAFLRHEMVHASVHAGSHIDAPGHYGPAADGVQREINSAPLRSFLGPGLLFDVAAVQTSVITRTEIVLPEGTRPGTIVLIRTGGDKAIAAEVIEYLLDAGIDVIGTDGASFDGPFEPMIERFLADGDRESLWPAHVLGRRRPYYQIERLANLDKLPAAGFFVIALPVLIAGATAAWTRAIAVL